jgi:hypothetical protein
MALKSKETPAGEAVAEHAREVFGGLSGGTKAKPKLKAVTVNIDPQDYAALKQLADELGLGAGAALRMALRDFLKRRGAL